MRIPTLLAAGGKTPDTVTTEGGTPLPNEKGQFLEVALLAAKKADIYIKDEIARGFTTKTKQDGSFVTNVDTGAEEIIRKEIERAFADHNITGEELGSSSKGSDYRWYIDPIDGTLDFTLGLPSYGTIICLCYKDQPIVSVINHPSLNLLYHAVMEGGAYCNGKKITLRDIPAKQVKEEMIATGDIYAFRLANSVSKFKLLLNKHPLVRTVPGCFGHTLAVNGSVGAMVDYYLNYWDFGATQLLVEEAGGKFVITGTQKLADGRSAYNMICGKRRVVNWLLKLFK